MESHVRLKQAVRRNRVLSREGILEQLFERLFRGLVYAQIWEDPEIDLKALALTPECHVLAIASGGCNVLSYLTADPARITQMIDNLVSNAIKYGGDGNTVTVNCQRLDRHVRCTVTDQGAGIPAHLQREIFRPFHRLANSQGTAGAGLGLSICEAYTRAMNGTLSVQSEPGRGTTFVLVLPDAAPAASDRDTLGSPNAANATAHQSRKQVSALVRSSSETKPASIPRTRSAS